jgi:hypothetical protein
LSRFSNERGRVKVVLRDRSRSFVASVEDVLLERDFYAVETRTGLSQEVEKAILGPIDSNGSSGIASLLGGEFPPSPRTRVYISFFVAAQWIRGWDMREATTLLMQRMFQNLTMSTTRGSLREYFREVEHREVTEDELDRVIAFARDPSRYWIQVNRNEPIRHMINAILPLANVAWARSWCLVRTTNREFVTSDAPVTAVKSHSAGPVDGAAGFADSDEIALALDRRHALILFRRGADEKVVDVDARKVDEINYRTASSARRFIVHHPNADPLAEVELSPLRSKISLESKVTLTAPKGTDLQTRARLRAF